MDSISEDFVVIVTFHRANVKDDLDGIAELERVCFAPGEGYDIDRVAECFHKGAYEIFRMQVDDHAYAGAYWMEKTKHCSNIISVNIHPAFRGRSLSHLIIAEIFKNYPYPFNLEVRTDNTVAISLYKKHGFTVINRISGYYAATNADAFVMTLKAPIEKSQLEPHGFSEHTHSVASNGLTQTVGSDNL